VSYNEVANAFPSDKALKEIAGKKLNQEEWTEEYDKVQGELFKTSFFRVVLDEGHAIRNHKTRSLSLLSPTIAASQI
jgi:SNF2 family DNA or RNA helicase